LAFSDGNYKCILHYSGDCDIAVATGRFTCHKAIVPMPAPSKTFGSVSAIFLPSLLFFIFFVAVLFRLLRRSRQLSETDNSVQQVTTTTVPQSPEYEMSNVIHYPVTQMTTPNGQVAYLPQFGPSAQIYSTSIPNVVYVTTDPSALPPVYVATNPLPPQY